MKIHLIIWLVVYAINAKKFLTTYTWRWIYVWLRQQNSGSIGLRCGVRVHIYWTAELHLYHLLSAGMNGCQTKWNRYRKTTPIIYHHLNIHKRTRGIHYSNLIEIVALRRLSASVGWRQEDVERTSLIEKTLNNWQIKCVASRLSTFYDFTSHTPVTFHRPPFTIQNIIFHENDVSECFFCRVNWILFLENSHDTHYVDDVENITGVLMNENFPN